MSETSVLFSAPTLEVKVGLELHKRSTCKIITSPTSKPTICFYTRMFEKQPTYEFVLYRILFEIIGSRIHVTDYEGKQLFEFEMRSESDAETILCIVLKLLKQTPKSDDSIHSFLANVEEFDRANQISDIKVISSINTSLQTQVESLETLLSITPEDYYRFIQSYNLSSTGVRSIAWKLLLGVLPFRQPIGMWCDELSRKRQEYEDARSQFHSFFDKALKDSALKELEVTIRNDCVRTFSNLLFFKSQVIQDSIVRLLLVFAVNQPAIGYKQGMTDVAAMLLLCLYCDHAKVPVVETESTSFRQHTVTILDAHLRFNKKQYEEESVLYCKQATARQLRLVDKLYELTSIDHVEHDCFIMFSAIINQIQDCFVDTSSDSNLNSRISQITQIVDEVDPSITQHLTHYNVIPVLFLVRWIRLIVAREFSIEGVFFLWDRLFIRTENHFPILDYCCASMLLLKKGDILNCCSTADILQKLQTGFEGVCTVWRLCELLWKVQFSIHYHLVLSRQLYKNLFSLFNKH